MRTTGDVRRVWLAGTLVGLSALLVGAGCALFQSEQVSKGQKLYAHYCMHCHGEHGRQNEGYNWSSMPDPRPKDLSAKEEMSTFKDEELFATVSREMKDTTPEVGDKIGDDEFAVPTMPTFKYTLSEEELWAIVAYVRTLHGTKLQYDVDGRKKGLQDQLRAAQQQYDRAKQALETAEKKAEEEAKKKRAEVDDSATSKEQDTLAVAAKELERAKAAEANFSARPKFAAVARPDLTMKPGQAVKLSDDGKRLYMNKYGCHACHRVGEAGGVVGPALDRAGFRLNSTWVYRWIKYPQSMKLDTRMPNLGLTDSDAKAIVMYVGTLRAPGPDKSEAKTQAKVE